MNKELRKHLDDSFTYHFFFNHGLYDELKHYEYLLAETENFLNSRPINSGENDSDERFGKNFQYNNVFPKILWTSIFLSSYSLLETSLDQICNNLKKSNSYTLSLNDISGKGIFRSSLYLKKVCNISKPFQTNIWAEIIALNKIRNILVHADGVFSNTNNELIKACQKYNQIKIHKYDKASLYIEFDSEFCKHSLSKIEEFFQNVHNEMNVVKASL